MKENNNDNKEMKKCFYNESTKDVLFSIIFAIIATVIMYFLSKYMGS